jgi:hypothetical protein
MTIDVASDGWKECPVKQHAADGPNERRGPVNLRGERQAE